MCVIPQPGETVLRNVQPLFAELDGGGFAVGHNGNLTNGLTLRRQLVRDGAIMQSTTDTEVILHLVARARAPFIDRFIEALRQIEGAYAFVGADQQEADRRARPTRHPAAGHRRAGRCPSSRRRPARSTSSARKYMRDVENGEVVVFDERRRAFAQAVSAAAAAALHFRIYLFRPPGFDRRRTLRL